MGIIGRIRKRGWIAVVIVGIAIIAFIIGDFAKKQPNHTDLGKINHNTITYNYFEQRAAELMDNYRQQQQNDQIPNEVEHQLREQAWQMLVEEDLYQEQYDRLGLRITSNELNDMYMGTFIHPYLRQSFTDPQTGEYNTSAVRSWIDNFDMLDTTRRAMWLDLEKAVKRDRMQQKYSTLIAKGLYAPKAFAEQVAQYSANTANVRVAAVRYQSVDDADVTLTDADYQAYYNEHKAEFLQREEMRELDFILFPVIPTAADLQAVEENVMKTWEEFQNTEDENLAYFVNDLSQSATRYDTLYHSADAFSPVDSIVTASAAGTMVAPRIIGNDWVMAKVVNAAMRPDSIRASVIVILNRNAYGSDVTRTPEEADHLTDSVADLLRSGKMSFDQAVADFSDDPSKSNGGDQGWQQDGFYGFLNERIVSTPVGNFFTYDMPNNMGHYIVLVTGKTELQKKYRVAILTIPITPSEQTDGEVYARANQFAGQNRTHAAMMAAAQAENYAVRNGMVYAMSNNLQGVNGNAREIVRWAFDEETENGSVANKVFSTGERLYVVAALKDVYKKGYPELRQVRDMIESQVRIDKKAAMLMAKADEALKAGKDINAIATTLGTTVDTIGNVGFNDYYFDRYGYEPKALATVAAAEPHTLVGPVKGTSAVYLIQVDDTTPAANIATESILNNMQMEQQQKVRNVSQILKDKSKIKDERGKFF